MYNYVPTDIRKQSMVRLIIFAFSLVFLGGGAAQAQKKPLVLKTEKDAKDQTKTCPTTSIVDTTSAYSLDNIHEIERCYKVHFDTGEYVKAALDRNTLIEIAREEIDAIFQQSQEKSTKWHDRLQFIFDFLEIGASTAISLTNGARAKTVIGEALSLFQGSRSAFNKDFRFLEAQIIANKMAANRSRLLAGIYESTSKDASQYTWYTARGDLQNYLFAGTVSATLRILNAETGKEATNAAGELTKAKAEAKIVGPPSEDQIKVAKENFAALRKLGEPGFMAQKALAAERAKPLDQQVQATIDTNQKIVNDTLESYRSIYSLIEGDKPLAPLLEQIPDEFPTLEDKSKAILQKMRESLKDVTIEEFDFIFTKLNAVIVRNLTNDPSLNGRLKKIVETSSPK
jgi:hypothetical protein